MPDQPTDAGKDQETARGLWLTWADDEHESPPAIDAIAQALAAARREGQERITALEQERDEERAMADNLQQMLHKAEARAERLMTALREIAEGKGAYSRDPLIHASNTIEDMKALALAALAERQEGA